MINLMASLGSPRTRRWTGKLLFTVILAAGSAATISVPAQAALAPEGTLANTLLVGTLDSFYKKDSATDRRFFGADAYQNGDTVCRACTLGAATAAAVARTEDPTQPAWLDDSAIRAVNSAIATYQRPDGSFYDPSVGISIGTTFFANEIGSALVALRDRLSAADRTRWIASMRAAADYLQARGELTWYTNGNIVMANSEAMYFTYLATGDSRYKNYYDAAVDFALSPPQARWPGRGLIVTKAGTRGDGADGAGYLTEQGAGGLGYDAGYSTLTLAAATRLWLRSQDPRILRVMNLVTNQLLTSVDANWLLDVSGGTRTAPGKWPFTTGALAVLAAKGGRADLAPKLSGQWQRIQKEVAAGRTSGTHGFYRKLAIEFAPLVEAYVR